MFQIKYTENVIKNHLEKNGWTYIGKIKNNSIRKIRCKCPNDHESDKIPSRLMKDLQCIQCISITIEKCHALAKEKGFKFLSTVYTDYKTKYLWECKQGHQWEARYGSIKDGSGCRICWKIPFNRYVELINNKEGKILTNENDYVNTKSRIKYVCKHNHICESTGSNLLEGHYCQECSISTAERTCRKIFEYLFKVPFPKNREFTHPRTGNFIELDGYNKDLKLAFEYNGKQHYIRNSDWQTEEEFKKQQERDLIVIDLCKNVDIKLIVIPYTVNHNKLYEYIVDQFPEHNFKKNIDYSELNLESYGSDMLNELVIFVKNKFNGKILSNTYINCDSLLECECEKGHTFQRCATGIKQYINFCSICNNIDNMSLKISDFCKEYDYTLISNYINSKTDMTWKCNKCKQCFIQTCTYSQQSKYFHICEKTISTNSDENTLAMEEFCTTYDYTLLSEFVHAEFEIEWECNKCGDTFFRSWYTLSKLENLHIC